MIRGLWLFTALVVSIVLAQHLTPLAVGLAAGAVGLDYAQLGSGRWIAEAAATAALAGLLAIVLGGLLPAVADGLASAVAIIRLANLRTRSTEGVTATAFMTCFDGLGDLEADARTHKARLVRRTNGKKGDNGEHGEAEEPIVFATAPASQSFRPERLVDLSLTPWLFRPLAILLLGGGAVGVALGMIRADATTPAPVAAAMLGLAFLWGSATVIWWLSAMLERWRAAQSRDLCWHVDQLFVTDPQRMLLSEAVAVTREGARRTEAGLKALRENVTASTADAVDRLSKQIAAAERGPVEQVGDQLRDVLAEPLAAVADASKQIATDQTDRLDRLLRDAVAAYGAEVEKQTGDRLAELNKLLAGAASAAAKSEKSFARAVASLEKQTGKQIKDMSGQVEAMVKALDARDAKSRNDLHKELAGIGKSLTEQTKTLSSELAKVIDQSGSGRASSAGAGAGPAVKQLSTAADSMKKVQTTLDKTMSSILPLLEQIAANQSTLNDLLKRDAGAHEAIGQAADELKSAADTSRETVGQFIELAERLRDTSRSLRGARKTGKAADTLSTGEDLSTMIKDLRQFSEGATKSLPKL